MSKKLEVLEEELKKVSAIAEREKAKFDSWDSFYDEGGYKGDILLVPPYTLPIALALGVWEGPGTDITDEMGCVEDKTTSGRVRNKFEKITGTAFKNAFLGLGVGLVGVCCAAVAVTTAVLSTPFAIPKGIVQYSVMARNKAYNKRIEKAKAQKTVLEREIVKEVQNPTKDEDFKVKNVKKSIKKQSHIQMKENKKEEEKSR